MSIEYNRDWEARMKERISQLDTMLMHQIKNEEWNGASIISEEIHVLTQMLMKHILQQRTNEYEIIGDQNNETRS